MTSTLGLINSKIYNGTGRNPPPMTIKQGIKTDLEINKLILEARPYDFRSDLIHDPTYLTSFKPPFEPSINRDKIGNPHKLLPHADSNSPFNYIRAYVSPKEYTPKCIIKF